jgi:hypothetical protein
MNRATVKQEYQVVLRTADGKEYTWPISDCYFERKLETIGKKMLGRIRREDLTHQFSLKTENPHQRDCPWHGVDLDNDDHCDQMDDTPCTCEKKYQVTLLNLETNVTQRETFLATDRYAAVAKAFKYFAHKPQADCLDEWKVYDAHEVQP